MASNSQNIISVSLDGESLGIWDTRAGGESTAAVTKYRPGGSVDPVVDAGRPDVGDVTCTRRRIEERDNDIVRKMRQKIGRGVITITEQPTDIDGVAFGKATTWMGRLASVSGGDADSNSDDTRMVTFTATCWKVA